MSGTSRRVPRTMTRPRAVEERRAGFRAVARWRRAKPPSRKDLSGRPLPRYLATKVPFVGRADDEGRALRPGDHVGDPLRLAGAEPLRQLHPDDVGEAADGVELGQRHRSRNCAAGITADHGRGSSQQQAARQFTRLKVAEARAEDAEARVGLTVCAQLRDEEAPAGPSAGDDDLSGRAKPQIGDGGRATEEDGGLPPPPAHRFGGVAKGQVAAPVRVEPDDLRRDAVAGARPRPCRRAAPRSPRWGLPRRRRGPPFTGRPTRPGRRRPGRAPVGEDPGDVQVGAGAHGPGRAAGRVAEHDRFVLRPDRRGQDAALEFRPRQRVGDVDGAVVPVAGSTWPGSAAAGPPPSASARGCRAPSATPTAACYHQTVESRFSISSIGFV